MIATIYASCPTCLTILAIFWLSLPIHHGGWIVVASCDFYLHFCDENNVDRFSYAYWSFQNPLLWSVQGFCQFFCKTICFFLINYFSEKQHKIPFFFYRRIGTVCYNSMLSSNKIKRIKTTQINRKGYLKNNVKQSKPDTKDCIIYIPFTLS